MAPVEPGEPDPALPAFWSNRYAEGRTGWDLGRPHPDLVARLAAGDLGSPGRALVAGCGRGHDALALAEAGWTVTAVDFAAGLSDRLGPSLARSGGRFVAGDFFGVFLDGRFDLVFEHTFLCALPLARRSDWGRRMLELLGPTGQLAAIAFPADKDPPDEGPPYRTGVEHLRALLEPALTLVDDEPAVDVGRQWASRWVRFARTAKT